MTSRARASRTGTPRMGVGLAGRIAAAVTALVAGVVAVSVGLVWLRTTQLQGPELERSLASAHDLLEESLEHRLRELELIGTLLGNDLPFRALVAEGDAYAASILDNLHERARLYGCDALAVTDGVGLVLADTRQRGAGSDDLSRSPLLQRTLEEGPTSGVFGDEQGALWLVAGSPIRVGEALLGAVLALDSVDAELAYDLAAITGGEVVFVTADPAGNSSPVVVASSLALSRSELATLVAEPRLGLEGVLAGEASGPSPPIAVESRDYVAQAAPLGSASDTAAGFVVLRSVERELTALRGVRRALTWVGVIALAAGLLTSLYLGRRITRPIHVLVEATERIKAGDYSAPPVRVSSDELGRLAAAFRSMTAQLREKQEMDAYLAKIAGGEPAAEVAPAGVSVAPTLTAPTGSRTEVLGRAQTGAEDNEIVASIKVATATGSHVPRPGAIVGGRFEIVEHVGSGAMGAVWRAFDRELQEPVALKVLPSDLAADPSSRERLKLEIKLARKITHPNVVRTHDLVEIDGSQAISMEYVEGLSLASVLEKGRLPLGAGLRLARQLLAGLEAAHARGVVHRDLKPSNLLLDVTGTLKIADFGIARADTHPEVGEGGAATTGERGIVGTPRYMAPEQIEGKPADARSDLYAVGVILYEIFCGRRPFEADSAMGVLRQHLEARPPAPRTIDPSLPAALDEILRRALRKRPSKRFASAREFARALDGVSDETGVEGV